MPAHRLVNQHGKRDRLPADGLLRTVAGPLLPRRFVTEAAASLPGLADPALAQVPE